MLFQLVDRIQRVIGRPTGIDGCCHQLGFHFLLELLVERLERLLHCQDMFIGRNDGLTRC